jgi:hypothetical protein
MNSNLNDPEFIDAIIENQHLLLSASASANKIKTDQTQSSQFLSTQEQENIEEKIQNQVVLEEGSDFNIFDLLQSEERLEMASLLEAVNNSVDFISYLPQISVNSANKILENFEMNSKKEEPSIQDELIVVSNENMSSIDQFSQMCDLFSIERDIKVESTSIETNKSSAQDLKPARTSVRLASRKSNTNLNDAFEYTQFKSVDKRAPKSYSLENKKRKRSLDSDDYEQNLSANSENTSVIESNENSLDSSGLNDSTFMNRKSLKKSSKRFNQSVEENSNNSSSFEDDDFMTNMDENSNDREFINYVRRYERESSMNAKRQKRLLSDFESESFTNPIKKESNKEAATRYRLKKLSEKDTLFETRMHLEKENDNVKKKIELAQTEINYLKNILVQMLLTKGVL